MCWSQAIVLINTMYRNNTRVIVYHHEKLALRNNSQIWTLSLALITKVEQVIHVVVVHWAAHFTLGPGLHQVSSCALGVTVDVRTK